MLSLAKLTDKLMCIKLNYIQIYPKNKGHLFGNRNASLRKGIFRIANKCVDFRQNFLAFPNRRLKGHVVRRKAAQPIGKLRDCVMQ